MIGILYFNFPPGSLLHKKKFTQNRPSTVKLLAYTVPKEKCLHLQFIMYFAPRKVPNKALNIINRQ